MTAAISRLAAENDKKGERGATKADRIIKKASNIKRASVFHAYRLINDQATAWAKQPPADKNSVYGGRA